MKNIRRTIKQLHRSYESKFINIHEGEYLSGYNGLRCTIFGGTGKVASVIGGLFGDKGSDLIYPVRNKYIYN